MDNQILKSANITRSVSGVSPDSLPNTLLGPDDPPPCEIINRDGKAQLVLVCDHASRKIPKKLGTLGLEKPEYTRHMTRHIAFDIGAEAVTRKLSATLDAPAVLAGYSRLVLDLNRPPGHPDSIPEISDGTVIPANQRLSKAGKAARVDELHTPYHDAISHTIDHAWNRGPAPVLFSVHSFTPHFGNEDRPWDVAVLWKHDPRIAVPLMDLFRARGMNVGDNVPYSAFDMAYTVDVHAGSAGLAACGLEIRQDQVADEDGITRWARILTEDLTKIMANDELYKPRND